MASSTTDLFLGHLFDAFDPNKSQQVDFRDYIRGLSAFSKGTAEEKLECTELLCLTGCSII